MKKQGLIVFLVCILCVFMNSLVVGAADERLGTSVDGSLLTDGTEVTVNNQFLTRGTYLSYGTGSLSVSGYRKVTISGETFCYRNCEEVRVKLYLERLEGSTWENVSSVPLATANNTNYVTTSKSYSVAGGYYYRMRGVHVAINGSTTETTASYTDGIWIG